MTEQGELKFLPLGGCGKIGLNLSLYGYCEGEKEQWLMVDLGIGFTGGDVPGVDILVPDIEWIEKRREDLVGLVITHAHEDHIGAVHMLYEKLGCPVYATPFARAFLDVRLKEEGKFRKGKKPLIPVSVLEDTQSVKAGVFEVSLLPITHSIPQSRMVKITTPLGTIVHSGDWTLDNTSLLKDSVYDEKLFESVGKEGVLVFGCDSTNVMVKTPVCQEKTVEETLKTVIGQQKRRIVVTTFSSQISRIKTVLEVAKATNRQVILVGRSLKRFLEVAKRCGYLRAEDFLSPQEGASLPIGEQLFLCTGSQGEKMSAMDKIAHQRHPQVTLEAGDVVLFSAKKIPGNEKSIARIVNLLVEAGVEVISADDLTIHASGHAGQQELKKMYQWLNPHLLIPLHGESQHLAYHEQFAKAQGIKQVIPARNGQLWQLAPETPKLLHSIPLRPKALDITGDLIPIDDPCFRQRSIMGAAGSLIITLVFNEEGYLSRGLTMTEKGILLSDDILEKIAGALEKQFPRSVQSLSEEEITRKAEKKATSLLIKLLDSPAAPLVIANVVML